MKMISKGFTLIESLVAISVLMLIVSGTSSAVQTAISSYIFSRNEITAFYLAQEGVEHIRNLRDQNSLNGSSWLAGIAEPGDPCQFDTPCRVDVTTTSNSLTACPALGQCPLLKQNPLNGFYNYGSGPDTAFRREIVLENIVPGREAAITVTITWTKGMSDRTFRARENILNWQ